MHALDRLRKLGRGEITYEELKAEFEQTTTFRGREPTQGNWGAVWARAEELPDDDDVPEALYASTFAGYITREQERELMAIWTRKVTG